MVNLMGQHSFVSTPIIRIQLFAVGLSFCVDDSLLNECIGMLAHTSRENQATRAGKTQANPTIALVQLRCCALLLFFETKDHSSSALTSSVSTA